MKLNQPKIFFTFLIIFFASGCLESKPRSTLEITIRGPIYPRPRCVKGSAELGNIATRGEPISGAQVIVTPGDYRGTTDSNGVVKFADMPANDYSFTATADAYQPLEAKKISLAGGKTLQTSANLAPCVSIVILNGINYRRLGFGKQATLAALPSPNCDAAAWKQASFSWTQLEGPDVSASITDTNKSSLAFTTAPLEKVRVLPDQPQMLSFSPDEAGEYVFQLTARRADGQSIKNYIMVASTMPTGGMNSVPPGYTYYFIGPKEGTYNWQIKGWPDGWSQYLGGETTRTPSITALPNQPLVNQPSIWIANMGKDKNGQDVSTPQFSMIFGRWNQVNRDCGRSDCHPNIQSRWEKTKHGTTWKRMLDGELTSSRGQANEQCAFCHALGYDPYVANDGYDDVTKNANVSFPAQLQKGNYDALPQSVKDVSNVYCLACHGPPRVDPPVAEQYGRFSSGVCARCHDRLPEQDLVSQWKTSRMSKTIKGTLNGPELRQECAGCHTAQGFYYANFPLGRPPVGTIQLNNCCNFEQPITCQTCHSPMYSNNRAQIFHSGPISTTSGVNVKDAGHGALCMMCHNSKHDVSKPETLSKRLAPHSTQAEVSYGQGAYELTASVDFPALGGQACAAATGDGCVTCHMEKGPAYGQPGYRRVGAHTFQMRSADGVNNVRPCQACHTNMQNFDSQARADYDGNGLVENVRTEVDGLMANLKNDLAKAIAARSYLGCDAAKSKGLSFKRNELYLVVVVDNLGFDLGDCNRNGLIDRLEKSFTFPDGDVLLHKAAYNYLFVEADKSRGLHNHPYVVKLLQRTIYAVREGKNLPRWDIYK